LDFTEIFNDCFREFDNEAGEYIPHKWNVMASLDVLQQFDYRNEDSKYKLGW
jgi:hypothetical protein